MRTKLNQIAKQSLVLAVLAGGLLACNTQSFSQPPEQEQFGQKVTYNHEVDLLFVVDTSSSSMNTIQEAFAKQAHLLTEQFNKTGLDYRIAVTTMDMSADGEKGRFIYQDGTPPILTPDTPNFEQLLVERLHRGVYDWHPLLRGLEAVKAALSGSNAVSGPNAGFLREKSLLVLVFVSTGNDRSAPANYKGWLDQIRPKLAYGDRSWVAQFLGILPGDRDCKTAPWGYTEPGVAFIELAQYSGGAAESICDGDIRRALTNVKSRILEMITEYVLPAQPVVESIRVKINGVEIPNDPENGWTYNESRNSIVFHGTSIPPVDSTIDIQYDRVGLK